MKLTLIFLAGCISASFTYGPPLPFDWQQLHHPGGKPISSYLAFDDVGSEEISDNDNWNLNDEPVSHNRHVNNNINPLRQYHHNENVNQFYYPMAPSFMPTPVKERESYQISSRQKNRPRPYYRPAAPYNDMMNNGRFFGSFQNLFFPSAFYSYLSSYSTSAFSTTTTYLILNSTLTTTVMTSCIPISSFSAPSLANMACRRKRDLMNQAFIAGDGNDLSEGPDYLVTEKERWMDSLLIDNQGRNLNPDILSSKESEPSSTYLPNYVRQARSARYTITSTFTSYSLYTVNSTKTAFLGSSLFCMPSGFKTC